MVKPFIPVNAEADLSGLPGEGLETEANAPSMPTFKEVFSAHAPYVWRTLRRLGVHEADVKDVCQDVFLVVHRRLPDFDGTSSIKTWLCGIAIRRASQYRRRARHRREKLTDELPDVAGPAEQEAQVRQKELLRRLDAVLDGLDEQQREVFVLYELEGLTMNEIAKMLGCPLQTAYSRLRAARVLVRAAFTADKGGSQ
jgi:RNA polymerase sigma-70 factor (ECF subfamily)